MKKKFGILFFLSVTLFSACSTDFDVVGDWKETMVIYGLLDQSQQKQYIKINKAFLGEGNAFEYAQVKDSVQFANALSVTLIRINGATGHQDSYPLTRDNSIPKNAGTFFSGSQENAIYSFVSKTSTNPADNILQDATPTLGNYYSYKLVVRNSETGKEATATTQLVGDFGSLSSPNPSATVASLVTSGSQTVVENYMYSVKLNSAHNARLYEVIVRLMYKDSTDSGTFNDSIDWNLGTKETTSLTGSDPLDFGFKGMDFIKYVGSNLSDYPGLQRRIPGNLKLIVISAADDLNTFINVNKPSTSIIQEKPEYTNISNGLGIFSARMVKKAFEAPLSTLTINELSGGQYTACLKFLNTSGTWDNSRCHP